MEKEAFDQRDMTILIVDDEPRIRDFVRMNLELEHYHVIEASDGLEALEKLREYLPDLVILDVMMPEMDGFTFLRQLQSNLMIQNIPVVLLTATAHQLDPQQLPLLGVRGAIAKPFNVLSLTNEIAKALGWSLETQN